MPATVKNNLFQILFFTNRLYFLLGGNILLFILSFFVPHIFNIAVIAFIVLVGIVLLDMILLILRPSSIVSMERKTGNRFSNGDDNEVLLDFQSRYPFPVFVSVIDELPMQFQRRDF